MGSPVQLLVGLGNPGPSYVGSRHNAGFDLLDELASAAGAVVRPESRFHGEVGRLSLGRESCWLLKPGLYMNRSGQAVEALSSYYRIAVDEILVLHDDLDLPAGTIRLKQGGGHGGHNGLRDIISHLGSADFLRARIGIDRPAAGGDVTGYVLGQPRPEERLRITAAGERLWPRLPQLLGGEVGQAIQQLHTEG